jgi:GntR family transcriptional regulator, transcriptional repressor for pyruvate dehydrogenase complex
MEPRPAPFRALQRTRAFEDIILQIERAISSGELGPGDRLPSERELAETFGVSRSSVREALRALEMFGVVVARRGTGADAGSIVSASAETGLVSALRMHSALLRIPTSDLVEVRILIEGHAARAVAERDEPDKTAPLRELVERMRDAPAAEEFYDLDTSFHVALGSISGNALLPVLMEALRGSMAREMLAGYGRLADWEKVRRQLIEEHQQIVDAIDEGDPDAVEQMIRGHIVRFYRTAISGGEAPADAAPAPARRRRKRA